MCPCHDCPRTQIAIAPSSGKFPVLYALQPLKLAWVATGEGQNNRSNRCRSVVISRPMAICHTSSQKTDDAANCKSHS